MITTTQVGQCDGCGAQLIVQGSKAEAKRTLRSAGWLTSVTAAHGERGARGSGLDICPGCFGDVAAIITSNGHKNTSNGHNDPSGDTGESPETQ